MCSTEVLSSDKISLVALYRSSRATEDGANLIVTANVDHVVNSRG
jgi:hypothetical protein